MTNLFGHFSQIQARRIGYFMRPLANGCPPARESDRNAIPSQQPVDGCGVIHAFPVPARYRRGLVDLHAALLVL